MRRANSVHEEDGDGLPGEDSFLDIVANIVGILIILVMVVGVRVSHGALSGAGKKTATAKETADMAAERVPAPSQEASRDQLQQEIASEMRSLQSCTVVR